MQIRSSFNFSQDECGHTINQSRNYWETARPCSSAEHICAQWWHIGLFAISLHLAPKDHQIFLCKSF